MSLQSPARTVDVLIVGSGPVGATFARTIADLVPHASVLMVDVGPVISSPPGSHVNGIGNDDSRAAAQVAGQGPVRERYPVDAYEQRQLGHIDAQGTPVPHPGLFLFGDAPGFPAAAVTSGVGGMGAHWFGACPRPGGSERVPFIDTTVMDEALTRAEALLHVRPSSVPGSPVADHLERVLGGIFDAGRAPERRVQSLPMALVERDGLRVPADSSVILGDLGSSASSNFDLRPETLCRRIIMDGERAVGAVVADRRTGATQTVAARVVVVAADSLRTPQLLFASGLGGDALGRNLNEHPHARVTTSVHGDDPVEPSPADGPAMLVAPSGRTWIPFDDERLPVQVSVAQRGTSRTIVVSTPNTRKRENRLEFSRDATDYYGMPALRIHYRPTDEDHERMRFGRSLLVELAADLGETIGDDEIKQMPPGSSLHYQGTVGMGASDDGESVCDAVGRVWGADGVYVGGNGLIPTSTACNPTLTSVALATLAGRDIAARLNADRL